MQKRNEKRKECEKKENKIRKVKRDQHIKTCGSQIFKSFKSRSKSIVKRSWSETSIEYKRL